MTQENKLVSLATRIASEFKSVRQQISGIVRDDIISATTSVSSEMFQATVDAMNQLTHNRVMQAKAVGVAKESHIVNALGEVDSFSNWVPSVSMEESTDIPAGLPKAWKLKGTQYSSDYSYQEDVVLTVGGSYVFEIYLKADDPGSTLTIELKDSEGVVTEYASSSQITSTVPLEGNLLKDVEVPTSWAMARVLVHLPPGKSSIQMNLFRYNTGTVSTIQYIAGAKLRPNVIGEQVSEATTSVRGAVELATTTEANAGTDTSRAVTPAGLAAYYANHASQGPKGEDGSVWWYGPEVEPIPFMPWKIGDYFLSTTTGDVYRNS